jgi:hypothetical protein
VTDSEHEQSPPFPGPIRIDGYFAWTWRLFRACFLRLVTVFLGGVTVAALVFFGVTVFVVEVLNAGTTVEGLATRFALQVIVSTVCGTLLAAIASVVFAEQLAGHRAGADFGWKRLRPKLGHVVVSALYVSMPLLVLVLFLGRRSEFLLLPALLGPPVLVQAIVWEHLDFRDAAVRAKNLLAGSWIRVIAALLLLALGAALVQLLVLGVVTGFVPGTGLAASIWVTAAVIATTAPVWLFSAAAGTVAYLDLRARFEELDHASLSAEAERLAPPREAPSPG